MFKNKNFLTIIILLFLIIFLIILTNTVYSSYLNKTTLENTIYKVLENNEQTIFSINKIVYFSSASANTNITSSNLNVKNLLQYTDIAIYLNNNTSNFSAENTLKSVYIDNINYSKKPELGTPSLYYKNINDFSKDIFIENNKITNTLIYDVTSEDSLDYSEAILFNNCANPITLSYVNSDIKSNYTLPASQTSITYDGSLLKNSNILLNSISCSISFDINIINNLDEKFICPIYIDIPLNSKSNSIYNGNFTLIDNTNYTFFRYK